MVSQQLCVYRYCLRLTGHVAMQLLVGGAAGVGALWYYDRRLRLTSATDSMYHELSMENTGF